MGRLIVTRDETERYEFNVDTLGASCLMWFCRLIHINAGVRALPARARATVHT